MCFTYTANCTVLSPEHLVKTEIYDLFKLKKKKNPWQIHFFNKKTVNEPQGIGSLNRKATLGLNEKT